MARSGIHVHFFCKVVAKIWLSEIKSPQHELGLGEGYFSNSLLFFCVWLCIWESYASFLLSSVSFICIEPTDAAFIRWAYCMVKSLLLNLKSFLANMYQRVVKNLCTQGSCAVELKIADIGIRMLTYWPCYVWERDGCEDNAYIMLHLTQLNFTSESIFFGFSSTSSFISKAKLFWWTVGKTALHIDFLKTCFQNTKHGPQLRGEGVKSYHFQPHHISLLCESII